ncbi:acyltransferase family protein [Litorihabitans aurantiacus]|uniref:acyltransferase family protein n=1 Tax=Litorihabitans aurantiacus TaxID=1930061 RepID=UPI0024E0474E|nr:acyltransferase [Litorihabitans aurantiacus]
MTVLPALPSQASAVVRHLPALTGVRSFAVMAVVVTHVHNTLRELIGDPYKPFEFLSYHGWLAVEFFFLLSGFTLVHAYAGRMGEAVGPRAYALFVWRRFSRLWPVFAVTLVLTTVVMTAGAALRLPMPMARTAPDPGFFFQQLSLTWMWFRDDRAVPAAWNGASWYVSVEFLACVLFPLLLLVVHRLGRLVRTGWLVVILALTITPYAVIESYYSNQPTPYSSMLRVATFFTAGMLLRILVDRFSRQGDDVEVGRASSDRRDRPSATRNAWWTDLLAPSA